MTGKSNSRYGEGSGIALGICFGAMFGTVFDSLALCLSLGLLLGVAIDLYYCKQKQRSKEMITEEQIKEVVRRLDTLGRCL